MDQLISAAKVLLLNLKESAQRIIYLSRTNHLQRLLLYAQLEYNKHDQDLYIATPRPALLSFHPVPWFQYQKLHSHGHEYPQSTA